MSQDDTGLATTRTRLAWWRSSLGLVTLSLLLTKLGMPSVLQLMFIIIVLYCLLRSIARYGKRGNQVATLSCFATLWLHLWLSLTVMLVGIWFLLQH